MTAREHAEKALRGHMSKSWWENCDEIEKAITEAEERGRVEMREKCAVELENNWDRHEIARMIRALPTASPAPAHSSSEGQETAETEGS